MGICFTAYQYLLEKKQLSFDGFCFVSDNIVYNMSILLWQEAAERIKAETVKRLINWLIVNFLIII